MGVWHSFTKGIKEGAKKAGKRNWKDFSHKVSKAVVKGGQATMKYGRVAASTAKKTHASFKKGVEHRREEVLKQRDYRLKRASKDIEYYRKMTALERAKRDYESSRKRGGGDYDPLRGLL